MDESACGASGGPVDGLQIRTYWGAPGPAKSTAVAHVIKTIFNETGKKILVLIGDGSAWPPTFDMGLVDAGAVEIMDYTIRDWPISTLEQWLAEGAWPEDLDPNAKLMPMTPAVAATLGLSCFEGIAMAGAYIMGDKKGGLANRSGKGEKIGQDSPIMITDADLDAAGKIKPGSGPGRTYGGESDFSLQRGPTAPGQHPRAVEDVLPVVRFRPPMRRSRRTKSPERSWLGRKWGGQRRDPQPPAGVRQHAPLRHRREAHQGEGRPHRGGHFGD